MSRKKGRRHPVPREPDRSPGTRGSSRAADTPSRGPRMGMRLTRGQLVALLATVGLLAAVALLTVRRPRGGATTSEPLPPASAPTVDSTEFEDFVGSEACAACHASESEGWRRSTHAAAGGVPGAVRMIAPFDGSPVRFRDAEVIPRASGGRATFTVRQAGEPDRLLPVDAVIGGGHVDVLAAQSARIIVPVAPQPDEVTVEIHDAREGAGPAPVERILVAEPGILEKFLALEQHRNAR